MEVGSANEYDGVGKAGKGADVGEESTGCCSCPVLTRFDAGMAAVVAAIRQRKGERGWGGGWKERKEESTGG